MDLRWIDDREETPQGEGGIALVCRIMGREERLRRHAALVAGLLGCALPEIVMDHDDAGAPVLLRPVRTLHLSRASRDGLAVLAAAPCPVGVDIERVEPDREPAWNVLSPREREVLAAQPRPEQPVSFARIWSAKEAYLKALGTGLRREPSGFTALPLGNSRFTIDDPGRSADVRRGFLADRTDGDRRYVLAGILLPAA